jgi:hypothetical protein
MRTMIEPAELMDSPLTTRAEMASGLRTGGRGA